MVRVAIAEGIDPMMAIRMGSYNTARYFGLKKYGAVAPGRYADLLVVPDLQNFTPQQVYRGGMLVAENGLMIGERPETGRIDLRSRVNVKAGRAGFLGQGGKRNDSRHRHDQGSSSHRALDGKRNSRRWLRCK